jgi:ABC-type multidrug transport system ATPase subunit
VLQAKAQQVDEPVDRAAEVIDALGLSPLADRPAGGYSQGELRRLALAKALVHSPRILLLDEPTSGLDVKGATTLVDLIRRRRTSDSVMLISTHDPWLGAQVGQRVVTLERGEVLDDASAPAGVEAWRDLLGGSR